MSLTPEQLMIPRALCLGKEPGDPLWPMCMYFKVGDILAMEDNAYAGPRGGKLHKSFIDAYPTLFRPIVWWFGRNLDEMPLYLKWKKTGKIVKPIAYTKRPEGAAEFPHEDFPISLEWFIPATEAEYIAYQNTMQ